MQVDVHVVIFPLVVYTHSGLRVLLWVSSLATPTRTRSRFTMTTRTSPEPPSEHLPPLPPYLLPPSPSPSLPLPPYLIPPLPPLLSLSLSFFPFSPLSLPFFPSPSPSLPLPPYLLPPLPPLLSLSLPTFLLSCYTRSL